MIKSARVMKKAVAYLVPFIEKEKEELEQEMRAEGTWDENVRLYLEKKLSSAFFYEINYMLKVDHWP